MASSRLDDAIARIDNAFDRIEAAVGNAQAPAQAVSEDRHLRAKVEAALAQLDGLIAELEA